MVDSMLSLLDDMLTAFHTQFGEDAQLEMGDTFVGVYNNCICIMRMAENQELKFEMIPDYVIIDKNIRIYKKI